MVNPAGQAISARIPKQLSEASALKRANGGRVNSGMWVVYSDDMFPNKAGILTHINAEDVATVMLTTAEGENLLEVRCHAGRLRQARFEEIPPKRRPDQDTARALGYF